MAYATNAFIRRNCGDKISVHLIINDTDGLFADFPDEGFVMARTETVAGRPMILLNGEALDAEDWFKKIAIDTDTFEKYKPGRFWGFTISQLSTYPIWVCRKVANLFS